jgi:hypothetical protein
MQGRGHQSPCTLRILRKIITGWRLSREIQALSNAWAGGAQHINNEGFGWRFVVSDRAKTRKNAACQRN